MIIKCLIVIISIIVLISLIITISLCKAAGDADKYIESILKKTTDDKK